MTTDRQIEANRANAALSTGPKTTAGKITVSANAIRHGVFASAPIIPGVERAEDWEAHLNGVVQSLSPAGFLELRLAERVALLLWRLERVTRFETAAITVSRAEACDEPPEDTGLEMLQGESDRARLRKLVPELAQKQQALTDTNALLELLRNLPNLPEDEPVSWRLTFRLLEKVTNELLPSSRAPWIESDQFLSAIGAPPDKVAANVPWTAGLVRRGFALLARSARTQADLLAQRALGTEEANRTHLANAVNTLSATVKNLQDKRASEVERAQVRRTLPDQNIEGKILRYESHLNRHLFQTLHELERIQARRLANPETLPAALALPLQVVQTG